MSHDTTCHLKSSLGHAIACPQGSDFLVKHLESNGGTKICTNPSCPHQQKNTQSRVHTALVGGSGEKHVIVHRDV